MSNKNLIYQYWYGPEIEQCAIHGIDAMKKYAERIGADYKFERNPVFFEGKNSQPVAFSSFIPVFDEKYHDYDAVLTLDTDIFPVDNLNESIFDVDYDEMNICQEMHMPNLKQKYGGLEIHDAWSAEIKNFYGWDMPKNDHGLWKIYNGGLALYSNAGLRKGKNLLKDIQEFITHFKKKFKPKLFWRDQAYVHAMFCSGLLQSKELDTAWNTQIHWEPRSDGLIYGKRTSLHRPVHDIRNKNTKMVHVQLGGSGDWNYKNLWQVVNLPVDQWELTE